MQDLITNQHRISTLRARYAAVKAQKNALPIDAILKVSENDLLQGELLGLAYALGSLNDPLPLPGQEI